MARYGLVVRRCFLLISFASLGWLATTETGLAAKPAADLLPAATKFYWSVPHQQEFGERFNETQFGKLLSDPAIKPFLDDLPRQMREEASNHPLGVLWIDLGVAREDIEDLTTAEVAWALVHREGETPARVFIADVSDRDEEVSALLKKIDAALAEQGAKKSTSDIQGTKVTVFDIPPVGNLAARKLNYCQQDDQLLFADSQSVLELLLENLAAESSDVLSQQSGYQQVTQQCQTRAGDEAPDAVVYLVPVDLMAALQQLMPEPDERAVENLKIARKHNFDAISAVGGLVAVGQDDYDLHLRLAIYAPQPWQAGMRLCNFPNRKMSVPAWVEASNCGVTLINGDFEGVSKYFGPLFDDVYGEGEEGIYDDLKATFAEDPDGPQVDIDTELYARLSPQVTLLARDELPVTPDSPQRLMAFSTTDETGLAASVDKALGNDPTAEAQQVAGHTAYFSYPEEEDDGFGLDLMDEPVHDTPIFITCVANGHLMFATDAKILEAAIAATSGAPMDDDADFQQVAQHWTSLGDEVCIQQFARLGDSMHVNYELFRKGKKPNSGKSFKGLLTSISMGVPPEVETPDFDGSKLPPFAEVQQYFGLAGLAGVATEDGWYLEGFVLKKD